MKTGQDLFSLQCLDASNQCQREVRMVPIKKIIEWAQKLNGKDYVFGRENDRRSPDEISAEDCSELVQNACDQNGVVPAMPDGAINQYHHCKQHDTLMSIDDAINTYGALLFRITPDNHNHVAFSLGTGMTFEARGSAYGIGSWEAEGRPWNHAGLIPGADYESS
jgi:cell wall-associated NlpC family hydrolase